jgi:diguanylate cyclase (GGDEF)-like protein
MDRNLTVRFVNKQARALWRLAPHQCENGPAFADLLYDIAATGIYDIPEGELEDYVLRRFATVQSGNPAPMDVPVQGGRIIRAQCSKLPCDGRMLVHTDVTDLVERACYYEKQSKIDALTGLPNRRKFLELAEAEWERFCRYGQPFSLLALDLDGLKQINDRFGHNAGDRAIREVARVCCAEKRSSDVAARLAGDEFIAILPGTSEEVANEFACRLRRSIASQPLLPEGVRLRISVGVAEARSWMSDATELMNLADERLYAAKQQGRIEPVGDLFTQPPAPDQASDSLSSH